MDAFFNLLMVLAKTCSFADVTAIYYKKESVLQSFISGLEDPYIRQRILGKDVDLESALESAKVLKRAKTDAGCYELEKNQKIAVGNPRVRAAFWSKATFGARAAIRS